MSRVEGPRVPWNAGWSAEERFEVRPCRWLDGRLGIWQPHAPGEGQPIFAKPHVVRQRRSIREMCCTVCGRATPPADRWWFRLGSVVDGFFMTTEAPVHRACADWSVRMCPHLRSLGRAPSRLPTGYVIKASILGGDAVPREFGIDVAGRTVLGSLKIAWPMANMGQMLAGLPEVA